MKVLLYEQNANMQKKSGIGRALRHQKFALENNGHEVTFDPKDTYDFVHVNSSFPKTIRFVKKLQKKGIPVLVHGHSTYEDFRNSFRCWKLIEPWFDRNLTRLYGTADYIVTPTNYSKGLIENYKCTKCPVEAISNGIMLDQYAPNEEKVRKYREHFGIKEGQKVVIGVGLLFERKGLIDFFEIARRMPDVTFIWFGHLQHILVPHKINKAIRNRPKNAIMPGYIDGDVIKGAMQAADVFLFPSYEETEGIVALEALASRTPLLVRDIGVYADWLKDGESCFKAKDNDGFIEKINYILNNDTTKVTNKGYEVVEERSIEKVGKQLVAAYEKVIEITKNKNK